MPKRPIVRDIRKGMVMPADPFAADPPATPGGLNRYGRSAKRPQSRKVSR